MNNEYVIVNKSLIEKTIEELDKKSKKLFELSEKIKEEVPHLPDINSIGRLNNYIQNISVLHVEIELLKRILI